jgi:hypothetical protein
LVRITPESGRRARALRGGDGVLSRHRGSATRDLPRIDGCAHALELRHQLVVDGLAAGGVDEHRVGALGARRGEAAAHETHRLGARRRHVHRHLDLSPERLELLDGGGAVDVGGHEIRPTPARVAQVACELRGGGRLAGAVQADQHHDHG